MLKQATKKGIKNLPFVKNQLKKEILSAITDLHYNSSEPPNPGDVVNKLDLSTKYYIPEIEQEWIQKGRNIYPQGENPAFQLLLDVKEIGRLEHSPVQNAAKLTQLYQQHEEHIHLLSNELIYRKLRTKVFTWYIQNKLAQSPNNFEELKQIVQTDYFQDDSLALTFNSKRYLYFAKSLYYRSYKKMDKYMEYIQKMMNLSLSNPHYIHAFPNYVMSDTFNYIQTKIAIHQLDNIEKDLAQFKKLGKEQKVKLSYFNRFCYFYTLLSLAYYSRINATQKTIAFLNDELFLNLKKVSKSYLHLSMIYFCIIDAYFLEKDYKNAQIWIEKYNQHKYIRKGGDSEIMILFFEIACHYQDKNFPACQANLDRFKYLKTKYKINNKDLSPLIQLFRYLLSLQYNPFHAAKNKACIEALQTIEHFDYQKTISKWGIQVLQKIEQEAVMKSGDL